MWNQDCYTLFSQQMLNPQAFGNLTFDQVMSISSLVVYLSLIAISLYVLFSKRVILSQTSRIGICIMIVSIVISHVFPYLTPSIFFGAASNVVLLIVDIIFISGVLMLVWTSLCSQVTKVALTIYEFMGLIGYFLFPLWEALQQKLYENVSWEMKFNFSSLCHRYFYLAINVLAFIIVLIVAIRSWRTVRGMAYTESITEGSNG